MTRFGLAVHRTFHSLHTRNFRLFFIGQLISVIGTWTNATASAWLVLHLSDSGIALGINTALTFLPILLIGAFGGLMADRFDKRRILVGTQTAYAVLAAVLFSIAVANVAQLWMVYLLSFGAGLVTALDNPTRQSFYMELVGERDVTNAVSLNSAVFTGARIVGPALAGLIIAATRGSTAPCFLIDAISYIAVIGALLAMRPDDMHLEHRDGRERGTIRDGFHYVWETPELRRPLVVMAVVFTFAFNWSVLLPLLAKHTFHGGAGTFGAMSALAGLGSFMAALAMANRASTRTRAPSLRRLATWALLSGVALVAVSLTPTLELADVSMVPLGLTVMSFIITANSMLQLSSKPEYRGRVMALYGMVFLGSTPIGAPIAGWLAQVAGPRAGFVMGAAAAFIGGLGALWWRSRTATSVPDAIGEDVVEPVVI